MTKFRPDKAIALDKRWKKLFLSAAAVFLLLLGTGFTHSGQSYGAAENAQKMLPGNLKTKTRPTLTDQAGIWRKERDSNP